MTKPIDWLTARPIAHRGLHDLNRECWENSASAFQRAISRNFAIECDVQITADGKAVVFHDYDLKRLTGETGNVRDRTAAELSKLRIGPTDDTILELGEMLALVGGRIPVILELKGNPGHDDSLVAAVARAISGYHGHVAVMSFAHWLVREFDDVMTDCSRGLVAEGQKEKDIEAHFSMLAHDLDFVSYEVRDLPNRFVTFVREKLGLPVITWTVCDDESIKASRAYADQMTFEGFDPDNLEP